MQKEISAILANPCLDLQTSQCGKAAVTLGPLVWASDSGPGSPPACRALGGQACRAVV